MKKTLRSILAILRSKRGETLFEAVVSVLIFTLLIVTVSLIIIVSLEITGNANRWSRIMQNMSNATLAGEKVELPQHGPNGGVLEIDVEKSEETIEFTIGGNDDIIIPITLYESERQDALGDFRYIAFEFGHAPEPPP